MDGPVQKHVRCPEPTKNRDETYRWSKYRVTPSQWDYLISRYDGKCWACREREAVQVDHYHAPGTDFDSPRDLSLVRGAVCNRCNTVVGIYEERETKKTLGLIRKVKRYLKRDRPFA